MSEGRTFRRRPPIPPAVEVHRPVPRVFLSYRQQISDFQATCVHDGLEERGIDAFMDRTDLHAGDFGKKIFAEIAARPHFVALLSPASLDGIECPDNWMHREIDHALRTERRIIPLLADGLTLDGPLPDILEPLKSFNRITLTSEFADAALDRLVEWLHDGDPREPTQAQHNQVQRKPVERKPAQPVWERAEERRARLARRARVLRVRAVCSAVVVAAVAGYLGLPGLLAGGGWPLRPTTSTGPLVFFDDFSSDTGKWDVNSHPDVISVVDGHLSMSVRPGAGVDEARLLPAALSDPFTEVRFTLTITAQAPGGQGGGRFVVNPYGDQPQILAFGPNSNGAEVHPLTCAAPRCELGAYGDFTEAVDVQAAHVRYDEPIAVQIIRREGRLQFFADDALIGASSIDPGPLTSFRFTASAGPDESWDMVIDDLEVR